MAEQRIASLSGRQRIRTFFVRKLRRRRTTLPPIIYVLCAPSLAGGVKVVAEHVHGLCARGHDARIYCPPGDFSWFKKAPLPFRMFPDADALDAALREVVGIKVATWWQTAFSVQTSRGDGDRGAYLIQDEDQLTYSNDSSGTSYKLGLAPIVESRWVERRMREHYGLDPVNVGLAIDHDAWKPLHTAKDAARVLAPWRPGPNDIKGTEVLTAVASQLGAQPGSLDSGMSLVTFGMAGEPPQFQGIRHTHFSRPSDQRLRELYCQAGVFLLPSRHEGFGLTALEAMACGCPVVTTACHGNEEFCIEGKTALVRSPDDPAGLADACRRVCHDADLRAGLVANGRKMAARYRWERVIDRLENFYARVWMAEATGATPAPPA